ncbi:PAS domain-containing protein [Chryseolinea lacunae]|uniref:PAS domain-containing protein n=1 Tax=Chryseolinea lacunae TaxID=2801331 RepID=A0ABS1L1N5_9BACT|nr:PAS domain-containing protein [Chryseolinea lacunae]MBL0745605.1 PAS domain-containing protein [Chryseolinea lacunae]
MVKRVRHIGKGSLGSDVAFYTTPCDQTYQKNASMWLNAIWINGLKIGYHQSISGLERTRIMILNGVAIVTSISVMAYAIGYSLIGYRYYYGPLYILPVAVLVLSLNYHGKYFSSRVAYSLGSILVITYWCYEGRGNGNEYTLVGLATTCTLIFSQRWIVYSNNFVCLLIFSSYKYLDQTVPFEPDQTINYNILPWIILSNTVAVIAFQMTLFRDLAHYYDRKLLTKYHEKNTLLAQQKRTEEQLKASNDRFQAITAHLENVVEKQTIELQTLVNAINVNIFMSESDLNGRFTNVNEHVVIASEYSREELIGSHYTILASGRYSNDFFEERRRTLMEGRTWRGEVEHKTKHGALLWFDCVVIPIQDGRKEIQSFLTLGLSITERKVHEQMMNETHKLLEAITFKTSHNIRGPLARVKGLAELVKRDQIGAAEFKMIAEKMVLSSNELNHFTSELVTFVQNHQESIKGNSKN